MDAFGHVEMRQGDTLFVYSDKLFYDGENKKAVLVGGPSRKDVLLKDSQATLTTDSLNYDLNIELGWYDSWGRLEDKLNVLTSKYGEYSPSTKIAIFKYDVVLENPKDNFKLYTEELEYNTSTNIATINSETKIVGDNDTILTSSGNYNTSTDNAILTSRSTIIHKDSSNNIITLEGDSIIYDKLTHISRAYRFMDENKTSRPMVLTDTARKMTLIGGFGLYNDSLREAYATDYPLLIEYSRPDSLFLRADTICTSVRVEYVWPDSLQKALSASVRERLNGYTSLQDIADDLLVELLLIPRNMPRVGVKGKLVGFSDEFFANLNELTPEEKQGPPEDKQTLSTPEDKQGPPEEKLTSSSTEERPDSTSTEENPAATSPEEKLTLVSGELEGNKNPEGEIKEEVVEELEEKNNKEKIIKWVEAQNDNEEVIEEIEVLEDSVQELKPQGPRLDKLGRDSTFMVPKEFNVARAIGKARVFNQDIQGVADTMIYQEYDTMLYLIRKPIVWSGERQVYGSKINIHLNDSNVDRVDLPESGFMAEYIDEDFYNQLSGKKMIAHFKDNELQNLYVDGNVETIFLPMENDSTYNRMVTAESSFLTIDMTSRQMDKLKMWPEVTGTVIPLFMVKKTQQYLPGFRWYDYLRPKREWYGFGWKWIDDLGEVPDALEQYFSEE